MKKLIFGVFLLTVIGSACTKECKGMEANGTVVDATGLDGCGKMIVLDSGEALEIISLPDNVTLIVGKKVRIHYKEEPRPSICMAGKTVHITCLQYI